MPQEWCVNVGHLPAPREMFWGVWKAERYLPQEIVTYDLSRKFSIYTSICIYILNNVKPGDH